MLKQMSAMELSEWVAYYEVEPFGEERADYRSAIIAWVLATINAKKGYRPKVEAFMLIVAKAVEPQSADHIRGGFQMIYDASKGAENADHSQDVR